MIIVSSLIAECIVYVHLNVIDWHLAMKYLMHVQPNIKKNFVCAQL